ncbi:MAG: PAS domain-containing protein [Alphaproteobacteria bacterium]|nr:PAS domain-containing protein [Alphaproteobacteria bacterium]
MERELTQELGGIQYWETDAVSPETVANPLIHELYRYWEARRGPARLPAKRDFDPLDHPRALGTLMILERLEDGDYLYRLHGLKAAEMFGRDLTGHRLREVAGDVSRFFIAKYDRCLELGRPLYVLHRPVQMKTVAELERLLMPFADDAGEPRFVVAYTAPYAMTGEVAEERTSRMS